MRHNSIDNLLNANVATKRLNNSNRNRKCVRVRVRVCVSACLPGDIIICSIPLGAVRKSLDCGPPTQAACAANAAADIHHITAFMREIHLAHVQLTLKMQIEFA